MTGSAADKGVDDGAPQSGRRPGLFRRLVQAFPPLRLALAGVLLWASAAAASAAANLVAAGWEAPDRIATVAALYAAGAAIAFPFAYAAARLLAASGGAEARFAAAFLSFTAMTIGITVAIYALDYRQYYAHWHADPFSLTWVLQFVFTTLGAVYQFTVTGIRLYFPIGFVALLAVSTWFSRHRA